MKIGCALLAAGAGVRFGGGKLMHLVDGEPMIARALKLFSTIDFTARVCVTRSESDGIRMLAQQSGFSVAVNPDPERGVGTSVAIATETLLSMEPELDGILYAVADQPYLTKESADRLLDTFTDQPESIVSLSFGGKRGNPAVFPKEFFAELRALSEDTGGSAVIRRHPDKLALVEAGAARELEDIDTRERIV